MTSHLPARQREAFLARFLRLGKEEGQLYEYIAARNRRLVAIESMQEYLPAIPEVGVVAVEWWPEPPRRHVRATQRDAAAPAAAPQPRHAHAPRPTAKQQSASWTFEQRAAWALEQAALVANCKAKTARMLATQRQRIAERAATAAAAAQAAAAQGAAAAVQSATTAAVQSATTAAVQGATTAAVQSATTATAATVAATATAAAAAVQGGSATAAATAAAAAVQGAPCAAATCPSVPASSAWLWNPVPWPQLQWPGTAGDRCAPLLEIVTHSTPDHATQAAAALPRPPPSHIWAPNPARAAAPGLLSQLCGIAAAAPPSLARGTTYALQTILTTTTAIAAPEPQHPCSPITTPDETSMYGMLQELSVVVASDAASKLHPAACAPAAAPQPQQPWWLWAASLPEAGLNGGATWLGSGASAKEAGYLADAPDVWCAVQVHVHAAGGDTPKDKSSSKAGAAGRSVAEKENLRRYALLNSYMKRSGQNVTGEPCV